MSESMSDLVFDARRRGEDVGLRFRTVIGNSWRRVGGETTRTEPRAHIVGIDDAAARFLAKLPAGSVPAPVGEVLVDKKWVPGLRFKQLPDSTAASLITRLSWLLASWKGE